MFLDVSEASAIKMKSQRRNPGGEKERVEVTAPSQLGHFTSGHSARKIEKAIHVLVTRMDVGGLSPERITLRLICPFKLPKCNSRRCVEAIFNLRPKFERQPPVRVHCSPRNRPNWTSLPPSVHSRGLACQGSPSGGHKLADTPQTHLSRRKDHNGLDGRAPACPVPQGRKAIR